MIDFLMQYGLFLAKSLTIVVAIIVVISAIFSIAHKGKTEDGTLMISSVNDKFEEIRQSLQSETLSKQELKKWLKAEKQIAKAKKKIAAAQESLTPRMFVVRFDGDMRASEVKDLRETISAILEIASQQDEVLLVLDSAGGFVHTYGLAASQLQRLRQRDLTLTVAIDKCAASGGYLMACVANKILAAPFAIVGSIGVIGQLPNFHRLLNKHSIDYEVHTAGEYKRTLTLFGKNTERGRKKFQEEIEQTHILFKDYIQQHRPQININDVATGEYWHAISALKYKMVDKIQTSDDFILEKIKTAQVFELSYQEKKSLSEKLAGGVSLACEKIVLKLMKLHPSTLR